MDSHLRILTQTLSFVNHIFFFLLFVDKMWSLLSVAAALFAAAASAVSTGGSRLLVVLDDVAEKDTYGQFLGDLTGMSFVFLSFILSGGRAIEMGRRSWSLDWEIEAGN